MSKEEIKTWHKKRSFSINKIPLPSMKPLLLKSYNLLKPSFSLICSSLSWKRELKNNLNNPYYEKNNNKRKTTTTNQKKTLASVYMGKRVDPFARAKGARASSDWLNECSRILLLARLDRVDPAGEAKVFIQRNVARLGGVTLPS